MGIGGGGSGWVAHFRVWVSLAGFQPVKAMDLREEDGVFRNFSASLTTYLPMKPEAQGERGLWRERERESEARKGRERYEGERG